MAANRKKVNADEVSGIATIKAGGTEVIQNVDKSQFQKSVASAYTAYNKDFGEANIKKIMDVK